MQLSCKPLINGELWVLGLHALPFNRYSWLYLTPEQHGHYEKHTNRYLRLISHNWYRKNKEIMNCGANSLGKDQKSEVSRLVGSSLIIFRVGTMVSNMEFCGDLPWGSLWSHWRDRIHTSETMPTHIFPHSFHTRKIFRQNSSQQ